MNDTVVLALIALPSSLLTAAAVFITAWRQSKGQQQRQQELKEAHDETQRSVSTVHLLVNGRLEMALKRIDYLERALAAHDIGAPIEPL